MFSGHKGLPFAEAVPPQSPASTKRRNRKDRNRFTGQRYRPMQSVVCQQAAQTYAKPAPNGATNVRGRTLRVPEGVSLPLRTIGNDTLRRFITDVRKAYRRVCADTRHLWPIHISISKDIRTIHSGSCTDVWTDDTDAGIAVRRCRNADMEVCRHTAVFPQSVVPVQKRGVAAIKERTLKGLHTRSNALIFQCLWKKNLFIWPFPPRRAERAKPRSRCCSPRTCTT